ncbi:MAG: trigger factor [Anaerolineales bacterium]
MKIESKELEDRQVELTVEVPDDQLQRAMRAAARRLSKETKIPGFRPGKAPYEVMVSKFGEETIFEEALDDLGQEVYRAAIDEAELEPYAPGIFNEIVSREPLTLRFTVPLAPAIDLGDYRSLRVPYEVSQVTDEALEEAMEELRQRQALIEPADRPAQEGDVVVLDVFGELTDDGEEEDKRLVDTKGVSVLVEEKTDFPVEGVFEHLKGLSAGEERSFDFTFPEDYQAEDLRGRTARFTLKCQEVKSRIVPDWSDDLAQSIGEFESLLDLRVKLRESLQKQAERDAEGAYTDEVMEQLVKQASVSYPPTVLEEEVERMLRDLSVRLRSQNLSLEDYLKVESKSLDDLRKELEPDARERIARGLILGEIVDQEKLDVEADELENEINRIVEPLGSEGTQELKKAFQSDAGRRRVALDLLTDKAVSRLLAIARGEDIEALQAAENEPPEEQAGAEESETPAPEPKNEPSEAEPAAAEVSAEDEADNLE